MLALAILFAGVPVVIAAPALNSGPVITVDICHPLQAPVNGSAPSLTPTLAAHRFNPSLADRGDAPDAIVASRAPLREAPDPPPPKRAS